jgi:DNA topoisomerase-1
LTTVRDRHAKTAGSRVRIAFTGKSGVDHEVAVSNRQIAKIVRRCKDLPGQELFQFVDRDGRIHDVRSGDVNEILREISGHDFTAKDFRTWAGTALAAQALEEFEDFDTEAGAKRSVTKAIERVAERLGNTKAVCRKCYVHPAVIDAYMDRSLLATLKERTESELKGSLSRLPPEDAAVLALIQQRMERQMSAVSGRARTRETSPRKSSTPGSRQSRSHSRPSGRHR